MGIRVTGYAPDKVAEIIAACTKQWWFRSDDFREKSGTHAKQSSELIGRTQGRLYGGETEDDFVDRLAAAIWKANRAYCEVSVLSIPLELPYHEHLRWKPDYKKWKNQEACVVSQKHDLRAIKGGQAHKALSQAGDSSESQSRAIHYLFWEYSDIESKRETCGALFFAHRRRGEGW